ncbi:MAG: hypothetical protein ACFCGT_08095 [Sandaracinaceae bacterium]
MRASTVLGVAAAALLGGCGQLGPGAMAPVNQCRADGDCVGGVCDVERGMCVAGADDPLAVLLHVVPSSEPFGLNPVSYTFGPVDATVPAGPELELPLGTRITGRVRHGAELVTADLTFTLMPELEGEVPTRVRVQSSAEALGEVDGRPTNVVAQLQAGRTYDVRVEPTGEWRSRVPPQYRTIQTPEDPVLVPNLVFETGGAEQDPLVELAGVVLDPFGEPEAGVTVTCLDRESGRLLSSIGVTGEDPERGPGYFKVFLPPYTTDWVLQVRATSERTFAGDLLPTFEVAPDFIAVNADDELTVQSPAAPTVIRYQALVEAPATEGAGFAGVEPVPNAQVVLRSRGIEDATTGLLGTYRTTVTTDDSGVFEAQVLPGAYDVVITPQERAWGVLYQEVVIDPPAGRDEVVGQLFTLPARTRYLATVEAPDGEPVAGATVRAEVRSPGDLAEALGEASRFARSVESTTDELGHVELGLEVGRYDLIVLPPDGTNFPWRIETDLAIDGTEDRREEVLALDEPVVLAGRARHLLQSESERRPVEGLVRAFGFVAEPDGDRRTVLLGEGATDAEGRFELLLSPAR